MKRSGIGWVLAAVLAVGGAALAWVWFAGGSGEPSTDLTTPTLATPSTTATLADETTLADGSAVAFAIDPAQSTASFEIDELLRGSPNRVVGTTDQVAGQVEVDPADLSTARFSQIVVNARTFQTDSDQRDRAMRGPVILNSASDEFELITLDVTTVEGLTGSLEPGAESDFQVVGDLTIKGTTREVVFDVTVSMVDETTITGVATAQVLRSDFDIGIPNVPFVADVADEVALVLDFVAVPA